MVLPDLLCSGLGELQWSVSCNVGVWGWRGRSEGVGKEEGIKIFYCEWIEE